MRAGISRSFPMSTFLNQIIEQRKTLWNDAKALLDTAVEQKRELTADEQRRYDQMSEDLAASKAMIEQRQAAETQIRANESSLRKLAEQPIDPRSGYKKTEARWLPSLHEYRELQAEQRAIGTTGAFISVGGANVYFDQLRKRTAVLAAGPTIIPIEHYGSLKVPAVTSSVSVGPVAEGAAITPSDPGLGAITLDPIKLAAMTLVDREAVEDSRPELTQVAELSLVRDMAVALDNEFINGPGGAGRMTGLLTQGSVTAGASTGTNGASLSAASTGLGILADTLAAYEAANADPDRAAWIMHARTWASIRKLPDTAGRPLVNLQDGLSATSMSIWGKPVYISNSVPITQTVGTSTDCSSILLADMSRVVVGQSRAVELMMSVDYAFNTDQVALRVTARYDIGLPQPAAVVKTVGVRA